MPLEDFVKAEFADLTDEEISCLRYSLWGVAGDIYIQF